MSATKLAEAGMAAVESHNWDEAIAMLSKAIDQSKSPQWLLERSRAYMETGQLDKSLRDAEYAYCTAVERSNHLSRKQMAEAQHRRSVIFFRSKRFADADACAVWSMQLAKGVSVSKLASVDSLVDEKGFYNKSAADALAAREKTSEQPASKDRASEVMSLMGNDSNKVAYEKEYRRTEAWRGQIGHLLDSSPADSDARKTTVKPVPIKPSLDDKVAEKKETRMDPEIELAKKEAAAVPKPQPVATGPFRSQMFQSDSSITISLFMKFPSKEETAKVQVDIQPNLITITGVPREPSTAYIVPHAPINPAKSTHRVATMKVELTLAKAQPGKWTVFGREELTKPDAIALPEAANVTSNKENEPTVPTSAAPTTTTTSDQPPTARPAYPTSSKNGPKNWDNIGNENDDDDDKDVDSFFKKLFKDASPDAQRAMMKSFTESNGTSLSTDWASVSQGPVKTEPPEGMEARQW